MEIKFTIPDENVEGYEWTGEFRVPSGTEYYYSFNIRCVVKRVINELGVIGDCPIMEKKERYTTVRECTDDGFLIKIIDTKNGSTVSVFDEDARSGRNYINKVLRLLKEDSQYE